jgi:hypothetical protein
MASTATIDEINLPETIWMAFEDLLFPILIVRSGSWYFRTLTTAMLFRLLGEWCYYPRPWHIKIIS